MTPPAGQAVRQVVWEPLAPGAPRALAQPGPASMDEAAEALFTRLVSFVGAARELATSAERFPWAALDRLVGEIARAMETADDLFWIAHRPTPRPGVDYLAFHQARVAVLALRVGTGLGYHGRRLAELGMAACLFDVGLWEVPDRVARQVEPLSADEQALYRAHPQRGAALVRRWSPPSEVVATAVLQHHEREHGQGYPHGLRGPAVHPDARIIGLVDAYAALTAPPAPRVGRLPHDAIREMARSEPRAFDPVLVKALVSETSLFPPGTLVRVSSGEIGRVVVPNRQHPLRPRVELLAQWPAAPRVVDLMDAPYLYITGAIGA